MANTITNKKHLYIVERLRKELSDSGRFDHFDINEKAGYDISCEDISIGKTLYFTVLTYSNRLFDATTLEEWDMARKYKDSYFFVAAVRNNGNGYVFYYFDPDSFMQTCSIPKFKINSNLRKSDFKEYRTVDNFFENRSVKLAGYNRSSALQLSNRSISLLDSCWKELQQTK